MHGLREQTGEVVIPRIKFSGNIMYTRKSNKFGKVNYSRKDRFQSERKCSNRIARVNYKSKRTLYRERKTSGIRSRGFLPDVKLSLLGSLAVFIQRCLYPQRMHWCVNEWQIKIASKTTFKFLLCWAEMFLNKYEYVVDLKKNTWKAFPLL